MLGLGGYCFLLDFQWRQETLSQSINKVYSITPGLSVIDMSLNDNVHINIYKFIAIIINLYFCILCMQEIATKSKFLTSNGYVIHAMSDNTSALSWMQHAFCS